MSPDRQAAEEPRFAFQTEIRDFVVSRAAKYFPELRSAAVSAKDVKVVKRSSANLLHLRLLGNGVARDVLVKTYSIDQLSSSPSNVGYWLRLCPFPDNNDLMRCEAAALATIHRGFGACNPNFRAIRLLEYLDEWHGIVMDYIPCEEMARGLLGFNRFSAAGVLETQAERCRLAGVWLRRYHEIPGPVEGPVLRADRASILDCLLGVLAFVNGACQDDSVLIWLSKNAERLVNAIVPRTLDTFRVHGDFWPGNVLIGADGRMTVIDTFGYGATSRFEDIGYFLLHLKAMKPQIFSLGVWSRSADVDAWESAFLEGYFGAGGIPIGLVRIFELLALLYKWAKAESTFQSARSLNACSKRILLVARRFHFRKLARSLGDATESAAEGRTPARSC